jgi:hypothetical protein
MAKLRKRGHPTKYKPIYCKRIVEFFDIEPIQTKIETYYYKNGESKEKEIEVSATLPTITSFATSIHVDDDTIVEWAKHHKKFSAAYNKAKKLQENIWFLNGLKGLYNPQFAIFVGKNVYGYKDKNETDLTSGGKPLPPPNVIRFSNTPDAKPTTK